MKEGPLPFAMWFGCDKGCFCSRVSSKAWMSGGEEDGKRHPVTSLRPKIKPATAYLGTCASRKDSSNY